jgi:hypothetical protein
MPKRTAPTLFFIVCALEGLLALLLLQAMPGQGLPVALLSAMLLFLAAREWRSKPGKDSPVDALLAHRFALVLAFLLFFLGLASTYVTVFSPLRVERLNDALQRWSVLPAWVTLIVAQFFCLAVLLRGPAYWVNAWRDLLHHRRIFRLCRALNSPATGLALLALSFLIGLTKVYFGRFVDEADTITVGWLISQGYTLYHSVFSHHFPLPYYWVALVVRLFGNSFIAVRISLLLLQLTLFASAMRITRYHLAIGLTSLAWNLINQFLRGQEAIYAAFEGLFMVAAGMLILSFLVRRSSPGKTALLFTGALLGCAALSDPLMVYPAAAAFIALFASGLLRRAPRRIREGWRRALWAGGAAALVLGIFAAQLLASGTAAEFYRDTIWFNDQVYSKYVDASPLRVGVIAQNLVSGLNVFDSRWVEHTSPFLPLTTYRSVSLEDENQYAAWIFSGLLFRLSILACSLALLLRRRIAAGIFLYVFSAALLVRFADGLYAIGFSLVSLFAAFYLITELRRPAILRRPAPGWLRPARLGWAALLLVIGAMQFWSAFRGGYFIVDNAPAVLDSRHVSMYKKFGSDIRALGCDQPDLQLAVFPVNPIVYFVTRIPPASKYTFMYPWVAEIGQQELIATLRSNPAAVVWINVERGAGNPNAVATYMADTISFLNKEYVALGDDFWISPDLARRCGVSPGQPPFIPNDGAGE